MRAACRRSKLLGLALLVSYALGCAPSLASVVTANGIITVASGGIAPGSSRNYYFFGGESFAAPRGSQPVNLTDFSLVGGPVLDYGGNSNFSTLQAPGGSAVFRTGTDYAQGTGTTTLATFKLTAGGSNQSFAMFVLFGNTDNAGADISISLNPSTGTGATVPVVETGVRAINMFVEFDVRGANVGDTFAIAATSGGRQADIGGVTFSAPVVVPLTEPATLLMYGVAAVGLIATRRRPGPAPRPGA